MNILVSACLLGLPCRYDATAAESFEVCSLADRHMLIPVCPEQLGGLTTPREPAEIRNGRVITKDGVDVTDAFRKGAQEALSVAGMLACTHAILKRNSPSCGRGEIYDGTFSGEKIAGDGVLASVLMENGIVVLNDEELDQLG